jgi:hypothetical protein
LCAEIQESFPAKKRPALADAFARYDAEDAARVTDVVRAEDDFDRTSIA